MPPPSLPAVVRRGALGLDVLKGLTSPVEHHRLAGVARPSAQRDVHVFRVELNGAGATAGLLHGNDGGARPAERSKTMPLRLDTIASATSNTGFVPPSC